GGSSGRSCAKGWRAAPSRKAVVPRTVVRKDRALRRVGERELEEPLDSPRVLAVRVRKVGREHNVRDAHQIENAFDWFFVALDGDKALPFEVLARLLRQVAREDVTEPLVVFGHSPQ